MAKQLADKVVIVTGAGSDVGRITAKALAAEGASIVAVDTDTGRGNQTVESLTEAGADSVFVEADVTDTAQVQEMMQAAVEAFGRLDYTATTQASPIPPGPHPVKLKPVEESRPSKKQHGTG